MKGDARNVSQAVAITHQLVRYLAARIFLGQSCDRSSVNLSTMEWKTCNLLMQVKQQLHLNVITCERNLELDKLEILVVIHMKEANQTGLRHQMVAWESEKFWHYKVELLAASAWLVVFFVLQHKRTWKAGSTHAWCNCQQEILCESCDVSCLVKATPFTQFFLLLIFTTRERQKRAR